MRDAIGNRIVEGSLLPWRAQNLVYRVLSWSDGGIAVNNHEVSQPKLVLELDVPLKKNPAPHEPVLPEFLCVVDPKDTEAVTKLLGEQVQ